jgi:hypothetical protein
VDLLGPGEATSRPEHRTGWFVNREAIVLPPKATVQSASGKVQVRACGLIGQGK